MTLEATLGATLGAKSITLITTGQTWRMTRLASMSGGRRTMAAGHGQGEEWVSCGRQKPTPGKGGICRPNRCCTPLPGEIVAHGSDSCRSSARRARLHLALHSLPVLTNPAAMTPPTMKWEQIQLHIRALNQRADALSQTQPYYCCISCQRIYPDDRVERTTCRGPGNQRQNSQCILRKAEGYQVIAHLATQLR
jgi:hypothetical protein